MDKKEIEKLVGLIIKNTGFPQNYFKLAESSRDNPDFFQIILNCNINNSDFYNNLGIAITGINNPAAINSLNLCLKTNPYDAGAYNNLGVVYRMMGQNNEALDFFLNAIKFEPENADYYYNAGSVLTELGKNETAVNYLENAVRLSPQNAKYYLNLGYAFFHLHKYNEAFNNYQIALKLYPNYPEAHFNLAVLLLLHENFNAGWAEFEWRRAIPDSPVLKISSPEWRGESLEDKTILVHSEQGFGDTIQFSRYIQLIREKGGKVIFKCQPELVPIMENIADSLVTDYSKIEFDYHIPLLSLPYIFKTNINNIPLEITYLFADKNKKESFCNKIAGKIKIGFVYQSNSGNKSQFHRSVPLKYFIDLVEKNSGINFYSLQTGSREINPFEALTGSAITDLAVEIKDFSDTAAIIANLDLVITIDTAVAHLAGAMGKRTICLLAFNHDWRWGVGRDYSLWYPVIRLIRQSSPGDWDTVFQKLGKILSEAGFSGL